MFDALDNVWRRLRARGDDWFERLRSRGLEESARWSRRLLGESAPEAPDDWSEWERRTLHHLVARLCDYSAAGLPAPEACGALEETLGFLQTLPFGRRRQLHQLIAIIEAGSLVTAPDQQRCRFSELSPRAADMYLKSWARSDLPPRRAVFQGLKSICMMGYWSRPETWKGIGYSLEANPGLNTNPSTSDAP